MTLEAGTLWRMYSTRRTVGWTPALGDPGPSDLFPFDSELGDDDTGVPAFRGRRACSADWLEHPACGSCDDALRRKAAQGRTDDAIWAIRAAEATEDVAFSVPAENIHARLRLSLEHWPERDNEAHVNLVMADGFHGVAHAKDRRATVRDFLALRAELVFLR